VTILTRRYRFSASHRLHSLELSESENQQLYGKCNYPYGHGHDYVLEVSVRGPVDPVTGVVIPAAKLDRLVSDTVLSVFASRNLNLDVCEFRSVVPTTENIAKIILGHLQRAWLDYIDAPAVQLQRVYIQETDRNSFEILAEVPRPDTPSEVAGRVAERVIVHG